MKRFWRLAEAVPDGQAWTVRLDGRPLRLPGGAAIALPGRAIALAVAAEWQAAGDEVAPASLPMTQLAGTLQRTTSDTRPGIEAALLRYGAGDMLRHRAPDERLAGVQARLWQPWLDRLRDRHGIVLTAGTDLSLPPPDGASVAALRDLLATTDDAVLATLGAVVPALGSLALGLALVAGELDPDRAFDLSAIEETSQAERWGDDEEAEARRARLRDDVRAAARFLALCRAGDGDAPEAVPPGDPAV